VQRPQGPRLDFANELQDPAVVEPRLVIEISTQLPFSPYLPAQIESCSHPNLALCYEWR